MFLDKILGRFRSGGGGGGELDELTEQEQRFLRAVAPLGLDWRTTRAEFAEKLGVTKNPGWIDTIELPPSSALSHDPLQFVLHHHPKWQHLPPEYASASYCPTDDVYENFARLERQLIERLGEGVRQDVSNALTRIWEIGLFEVKLYAWPPELQSHTLKNVLHEQSPRLALSAQVTIRSKLSRVFPDHSLSGIAAALAAGAPACGFSAAAVDLPGVSVSSVASIPYSVRTPKALAAVLSHPAVWSDARGSRFGVSTAATSFVFPRGIPDSALVHGKLLPARGPGGSELMVQLGAPTPDARDFELRTTIFSSSSVDGLTGLAGTLSELWSLPVISSQWLDE